MNQSIIRGFSVLEDYKENVKYDVVIIGAGLSGLTAAFRLFQLKPNLSIKILEAQDRIGGRILTTKLPAANNTIDSWDLGGTWIGNKDIQPFINQLLSELNIQSYIQNFVGKKILQTGGNYSISKYSTSIPKISPLTMLDTSTLLKYIDSTQRYIFKEAVVDERKIKTYDAMTAGTMLRGKTWTRGTSDLTKASVRACFGTELERISSLYLLMSSHSCGGFEKMIESGVNSSQGYKIVGGAQRICSRILEIIGYETLELGAIVRSVRQIINDKGEAHLLVDANGVNYEAKDVILAIPLHLIPSIQFLPFLSPIKNEFFASVTPGHLIKIILTYEKAFWVEEGCSGEIVTNGGPSFTEGCLLGPLCVVFDATTSNNNPALLGLIGGEQALQYENVSKEQRKEAVLKSLESFFQSSDVRNFIVYCEKIWRHEYFVGGCPTFVVPPGVAKHLISTLKDPEHRIHFAGSELAKNWMGFMEGAVQSGERAALEIISENYP